MDFRAILTALVEAHVDFVVIGGVGAVLQGVPMTTGDLDIVHSRSPENRRRLIAVLKSLEAYYRHTLPERYVPVEEELASPLHHLLVTRCGYLDLLGSFHGGLEYEDILHRTRLLSLGTGIEVRVLDLRALIEVKEAAGREKDLAQLPLLRRTLEEREKRERG